MRHTATWIALALMALALVLRLHGIDWGLPQVYEEAYPLKKAWPMWGWGPTPFTLDPKFFNYPSFSMYLQLLGQVLLYGILSLTGRIHSSIDFQLLYVVDPTPFYLMGRTLTTAFAVGTVGLTFAIGRRVAGIGVASVAAALVAVNGFHIAKSQVVEVDVPLTFFVMLTGWFALQIPSAPRLRNYLLAGLCAGLATSTKYSGGLLPVMILLAHFVALTRLRRASVPASTTPARPAAARRGKGRRPRERQPAAEEKHNRSFFTVESRLLWRNLVLAGVVCVAALLLTSPYIALDWDAFQRGFNYERTHMREGHFGLDSTPAFLWYARVIGQQILGWPLAALALAGLVWVVGVQRRAWAAILAIFPLVYVLILSSWSMKAARYILPVLPIACLMASFALFEVLQRLRRLPIAAHVGLAALVTVLLALPSLAEYEQVLRRSHGDTRTVSRQWILDNIPAGAYLVIEAYGPEPFNAIQMTDLDNAMKEALKKRYSDMPIYALLQIPMLQVRSELVAPFYELEQYTSADYLITTSSVRKRYTREPQRYARMMRFYEELERDWPLVQTFGDSSMVGPEIRIYKNPHQDTVLAKRQRIRAPASFPRIDDPGTGLVAPHMQRIGANLETFGFHEAAAEAFELALTYPPLAPDLQRSCVLRAMQSRLAAGQRDRALALLDAALEGATTPEERKLLQNVKTTYFTEKPAAKEPQSR